MASLLDQLRITVFGFAFGGGLMAVALLIAGAFRG